MKVFKIEHIDIVPRFFPRWVKEVRWTSVH